MNLKLPATNGFNVCSNNEFINEIYGVRLTWNDCDNIYFIDGCFI